MTYFFIESCSECLIFPETISSKFHTNTLNTVPISLPKLTQETRPLSFAPFLPCLRFS